MSKIFELDNSIYQELSYLVSGEWHIDETNEAQKNMIRNALSLYKFVIEEVVAKGKFLGVASEGVVVKEKIEWEVEKIIIVPGTHIKV